ncbi:hypothetical protein D9756_007635 [Leucocoprinus leucothites]|uniref:C2H2-type domain-containing protein n=1 Tax=Leucocoprinus leucothites TaxID=201217 RepID=A0A8H5FWX5_9AGAR|nr:hypothetical protein D9756_007635 [Leucoagaricus leucothites]
MHRDNRSYYDDPSQYPGGQYPSSGGDYPSPSTYSHTSYDYQQNPAQYYPPNAQPPSDAPSHPAYYRSMTPGIHSHRYSNSASNREYYSQSGILNSSSALQQQPYNTQSYYNNQYPSSSLGSRSPPNQTQFIPTPSEMANSYPNYPTTLPPHSPQSVNSYGPEANGYSNPAMLPQPPHPLRPSRISTGRPRTGSGATSSPTSATSPSGERFPCEKCGKTFSRSHDRKRHHETQHLPTPVLHRCRYCEKEFSRADSLKRHLDNGCDEMPQ